MSDYPVGVMVVAAIGLFSAIMMARQPDTTSTEVQVAQSSPAATTVYPPPVQRIMPGSFPAIAQPASGVNPVVAAPMPSPLPTVMPRGYMPPPMPPPAVVTGQAMTVPNQRVQTAVPMPPPPGTPNK